ncbi:MAG: right-handed parallel beta-helix repeat-containing protein [Vicinamibacterales bacterium]
MSRYPRSAASALGARLFIIALGVLHLAPIGHAGAQTPSLQPTEAVLHVNQRHARATDQSDGSADAPFRTIQAACQRALLLRAQGQRVRVAIHEGIYRESISIGESTLRPDAPQLVIEGIEPNVAVSGSDVLPVLGPDRTNVRSIVWRYRWGQAAIPEGWDPVAPTLRSQPVVLRSEMLFVGGTLLQQVMSADDVHAGDGRYWVEESPSDAVPGTVWWTPQAAADDAAAVAQDAAVEVAVRPSLFSASRIGNLVVRGITFRHAATPLQEAAVRVTASAKVLFEDLHVEWNNWYGLAVYESQNVTLRRVAANNNGAGGVTAWRVRQLVVEDVQASYNNWRGAWGGFTGWATGQKFFSLHDARFTRYQAIGNRATGLWFDTDHADVLIEDSRLCDNLTSGLVVQAVQGPLTVRDSVICRNGETGLLATTAADVTLEGNIINGNGEHQVDLPWQSSEHEVSHDRNYETGETMATRSERWTMKRNLIEGDGQSVLFSVGQWPEFLTTLQSDENEWVHSSQRDVMGLYPAVNEPMVRFDFEYWRVMSRQDGSSPFILTSAGGPSN